MVAAFDVVTDDLETLFQDLTARIAELTQGHPDRLDPISNAALPPPTRASSASRTATTAGSRSRSRSARRCSTSASGCAGRRPPALSRMPSFPGDNLDPRRCHGDLLVLVQSDHAMITHHAVRDVMRRTKGRLEGRWAQSCFQRFAEDNPSTRKREGVADARGLLGFPDGSQNIGADRHELIFTGEEAPEWARGGLLPGGAPDPVEAGALGPALAHRPGATRSAARRCPARRSRGGARRRCRSSTSARRSTPTSGWPTRASRATSATASCAGPFVFANGFDDYGLLDSGSVFLAFCRDLERQFAHGQAAHARAGPRRVHGRLRRRVLLLPARGGGRGRLPRPAPGRARLAPRQRAPVRRERVVAAVRAHRAGLELPLAASRRPSR